MNDKIEPKNKIITLKKVWLIKWGFHSNNEDVRLADFGINNKFIDIVSVRVKLEDVMEYVKDIYKIFHLSFSEKADLCLYNNGRKNRYKMFSGSVPVHTSFNSELYKNLIMVLETKGVDNKEYENLSKEWAKYPEYVIVGHNPYIEAWKVFNFTIYENENGNEILEWERKLITGEIKKENNL